MKLTRAILMLSTALSTPAIAFADPVSAIGLVTLAASSAAATAVGGGILGALVATAIGVAGTFAKSLFAPSSAKMQAELRTMELSAHPAWRFAFGEFETEGAVVYQYVNGEDLYVAWLLNDGLSDSITSLKLNDVPMTLLSDAENDLTDFSKGAKTNTPPYWDDDVAEFWFAAGTQTTWPADFSFVEGGDGNFTVNDTWAGKTILFGKFTFGADEKAHKRWSTGAPPRVKVVLKGMKVYDPRLDSTSGVTGASGSHRPDDNTTWEWSANPALCALHTIRQNPNWKIADERILIQQFADAADACGEEKSTTVTLNSITNAGTTASAAIANGVTVSGFRPNQLLRFSLPTAANGGWRTNASGDWGNGFDIAPDGVAASIVNISGPGYPYASEAAAFADFPANARTTSGTTNVLCFVDNPTSDNPGDDLDVKIEARPVYRCDGLLKIETDEWSILDGILDSMAGHLDVTAGKIGVRAGVWVAPTDTLSEPIGEAFEYIGREDPGFAKVVPSFISRVRGYEETDGTAHVLRSGDRTHNLQLSMVREPEQARRLAKIFGERAKKNRTLTLMVSGQEWGRRVGDRVTVSMPNFARADGIYRVVGWRPITEPLENGALRLRIELTLQEDEASTYSFGSSEYASEATEATLPDVTPTANAAVTISAAQSDYRDSTGTDRPRLQVTVTPSALQVSNGGSIEIQTKAGSGSWTPLGTFTPETTTVAYLEPVTVGATYTARARHSSGSLGVSDWAESSPVTIVAADISTLQLADGSGSLKTAEGFYLLLAD